VKPLEITNGDTHKAAPTDKQSKLESTACRVCGQPAPRFFNKLILGKHLVAYYKCSACGHVQTETPHWLEEAYQGLGFQRDVGMADRCVWTAQTTVALAGRLGIGPQERCLDWGGGTGLFVRLCRDHGMNFLYRDPYARNVFAQGFEAPARLEAEVFRLITAFEVAEHFANPLEDFGALLRLTPAGLLFSTLLYQGQAEDWWYFLEDGQHIAFYTRKSLETIGRHHGYHLASNNCDLHLFSREKTADRILDSCRKSRERLAARYRKRHGSRILEDFEFVTKLLQEKTPSVR
jgi:hypothetical protein